MAFTPIDNADIEVGKPTKKRIFQTVKDNFDDHENRIDLLQAGASKVNVFNFEVFGFIDDYNVNELESMGLFESPAEFNVIAFTISLANNPQFVQSSLNGVLELDLEKSTDNGINWTSVTTTNPTIPDGVNNTGYKSIDGVLNPALTNIVQGDLLRVKMISKKDLQGSFKITVYGEV